MATSNTKTVPTNGGVKSGSYGGVKSGSYGGKTTEQMKKLGRTATRYAAQGKKV
jgi:hypothetical protein